MDEETVETGVAQFLKVVDAALTVPAKEVYLLHFYGSSILCPGVTPPPLLSAVSLTLWCDSAGMDRQTDRHREDTHNYAGSPVTHPVFISLLPSSFIIV
jgi:hypothetical protein